MKPMTIVALAGVFLLWTVFMLSIPKSNTGPDALSKFMKNCKDDLSATMTVGTFQNSIAVHCSKIYKTVTP